MGRLTISIATLAPVAFLVVLGALMVGQDKPAAQDFFADGHKAFDRKDYTGAAKHFGQAFTQRFANDKQLAKALVPYFVSLAETGDHKAVDQLNLSRRARRLLDLDARVDAQRLFSQYYAARDHTYWIQYRENLRDYDLDWQALDWRERARWSHRDTTQRDIAKARALIADAYDLSEFGFPRAGPDRERWTRRQIALALDCCDLIELDDRINGPQHVNYRNFFGSSVGMPYRDDETSRARLADEEPGTPAGAAIDHLRSEQYSGPESDPFTRRGYYLQPRYDGIAAIKAMLTLAERMAENLDDSELEANILYRRATLMINVGLYGNYGLNGVLTDWASAGERFGDPKNRDDLLIKRLLGVHDPRPVLNRLLEEHPGSVWSDEARFLLGYVAQYVQDFKGAAREFKRLQKDYPKSKFLPESKRLIRLIETPRVFTTLSAKGSLIPAGTSVTFDVHARNVKSVKMTLRRVDLGKLLFNTVGDERVFRNLADLEKLAGFQETLGPVFFEQSMKLDPARANFYQTMRGIPLYTGAIGVYLLEVDGGNGASERKLIQVGDLTLTRRRTNKPGKSERREFEQFWLTTRDGHPIVGARIHGGYHEQLHVQIPFREEVAVDKSDPTKGTRLVTRQRSERRFVTHMVEGETDGHGLLQAPLPAHALTNFWAAVEVAGVTYLINDANEPQRIRDYPDWLERPAQQPLRDLRAFVYSDRPVYRPGDEVRLRVIVRDPTGASDLSDFEATVSLHADGVEQFRAPALINEFGAATIELKIPLGAPFGRWTIRIEHPRLDGRTSFGLKVQEYFKKDVHLTIKAPGKPVSPGSNVKVPVILQYLAGGAVRGGKIEYSVRADFKGGSINLYRGKVSRTNDQGRVEIALDTASISESAGGRAVTLWISAKGFAPGGQAVDAEATVRISGSGITVKAEWPDANWLSNRLVGLRLRVTDSQGRRLEASGKVRVLRITDQKSLRSGAWSNPSLRRISETSFTDSARADRVEILLPRGSGSYRVEVEGSAGGKDFRLSRNLLLVGNGLLKNLVFGILPEFDEYDCTRPARVLVCNPGGGDVLVGMHADGRNFDHRLLKSTGTHTLHSFDVPERWAPHVHFVARRVRKGLHESCHEAIRVKPASRRVRLSVRFNKPKYEPGETVQVDIFTFDHEGKPVQTEVALSVWDSALKEFASSALGHTDLYDHFFSGWAKLDFKDRVVSAYTEIRPVRTRPDDSDLRRIRAMPAGSFNYGSLSWSSRRQLSAAAALALIESGDSLDFEIFEDARISEEATDDHNEDPMDSPGPFIGRRLNSSIGLGGGAGGGGGRGGRGGFAYRRARGGGGRVAQGARVRGNFRDSAYFNGSIRTNAEGVATLNFTLPDNLTEWTFEAVATTRTSAIGQTSGTFKVAKKLNLRLIGPRTLTEGDEVELTVLAQNLTDASIDVVVDLALNHGKPGGAKLILISGPADAKVTISAGATTELRWRVEVAGFGSCSVRAEARGEYRDALVWKYTVNPRGMRVTSVQRFEFSEGENKIEMALDLPEGAILARSAAAIHMNGSLLAGCVDAMPRLINYPYGCVEQTTNRFVPLLSVLQMLRAGGYSLYDLAPKRAGYGGAVAADRWPAKLQDQQAIQSMIDKAFGRLRGYQHRDGGWGWWKRDASQLQNSTVVLAGLARARTLANSGNGDISLPASDAVLDDMFERAAEFLLSELAQTRYTVLRNRALRAAAMAISFLPLPPPDASEAARKESLQARLNALLTLAAGEDEQGGAAGLGALISALHYAGRTGSATRLAPKLEEMADKDESGGLAFPSAGRSGSRWHDDPLEAHGLAIEALSLAAPKSSTLERAVKHLMCKRNSGWWGNTRATGVAIGALASYVSARGDNTGSVTVQLNYGGEALGVYRRTKAAPLASRSSFQLNGALLSANPGRSLTLTRSGAGAASGSVTVYGFVPLKGTVKAVEHGIRITRLYERRVGVEREIEVEVQDRHGRVIRRFREIRTEYEYREIKPGGKLEVGDIVRVTLNLWGNWGRRNLCLEDARPGCLEPLAETAPGSRQYTREDRDSSSNFYIPKIDIDSELLRYNCVVVCPGRFTALPARVFDMYDETVRGHSASSEIEVGR